MMVSYGRCAQKICRIFAEHLGITEKQALGMGAPFGCGLGHAETCGCVAAALLVLGLRHAPESMEDAEKMAAVLQEKSSEFEKRFVERWGGLTCKAILKTDIAATSTAMKEAAEAGLFATICAPMIEDTCTILKEMLEEKV